MSFKKIIESFQRFATQTTLEEILDAKYARNWEKLNEATLSRVYQHFLNSKQESFGIVTAWKYGFKTDANQSNMQQLSKQIQSEGLGFIKLRGFWESCTAVDANGDPIPWEQCPQDKKVQTGEPSYFVIGCSKDQIKNWVISYNQESGIYNGPDTNGHTVLVLPSGNEIDLGQGFHPQQVAQGYSKIKGKTFFFEYVQQSNSLSEAMVFQHYSKKYSKKPKG